MLAKTIRLSTSKLIRLTAPLLKGIVLLVFMLLLYRALSDRDQILPIWETYVSNLSWSRIWYLGLVVILMIINWTLESIKWRFLLSPIVYLSPGASMRAVLVGVTTSIFTPNRIGEYLGRVMVTPSGSRWQAAFALSLGSIVQMGLIVLGGVLALWYTMISGAPAFTLGWLMYSVLIVGAAILIAGYFKAGVLLRTVRSRWGTHLGRLIPYFEFLEAFKPGDLGTIFLLTFLRLVVYVVQYWLLLIFFGVDVAVDLAFSLILISYLIQTGLPLPALLALAARGEVTLLVWQNLAVNELSLLSASYGLWVLNIVFPALIGMGFVLKMRTQDMSK